MTPKRKEWEPSQEAVEAGYKAYWTDGMEVGTPEAVKRAIIAAWKVDHAKS